MTSKFSRRKALSGAVTAGVAAAAAPSMFGQGAAGARAGQRAQLPDVFGPEFMYQWSPPENVKRDLTPGNASLRLSHIGMTSAEGTDYDALFKRMNDNGWAACEAGSAAFLSRKAPDSEVMKVKASLKAHDIDFYNIHCAGNIIAPDPDADRWQRHIIDAIHAAEQYGCQMILTHAGSMYPNRNTPHPQNWGKEAWQRTVNALKRIAKDTAGSKVWIAIEPVNSESINNPWAQVRLREEVGDPRIMSGLDITNFVHPGIAFRMSEFTNVTFDLLEDQLAYIHMKDFVWNGMMAGLNWAMNGTGNMDYETFLVRISRVKRPIVNCLVEFLSTEEEYEQAQRNIRATAKKVGVKILGTQKPPAA